MLTINKYFRLVLICFVFCGTLLGGLFLTSRPALAFDESAICYWKDQGVVQCKFDGDKVEHQAAVVVSTAVVASFVPGVGTVTAGLAAYAATEAYDWIKSKCYVAADCDDYQYNPEASFKAGYPIFRGGKLDKDHPGALHFILNNPMVAYGSMDFNKIDPVPASDDPKWFLFGNIELAATQGKAEDCGILKPTNCTAWAGPNGATTKYTGKGLDTNLMNTNVQTAIALGSLKKACEGNAPLGFITCPIYEGVLKGISNLIGGQGVSGERQGLLIDFLTIEPLKSKEGVNVFQQIVSNVVAVANFFYVIVFLVLIFSSSLPLGLDNYTIKKTLPKFIAAVIMTQFAYVICGVIVDFFNLLGTIIPNMIFALQAVSPSLKLPTGNGGAGLQEGLAGTIIVGGAGAAALISSVGWILIFILALLALVAILVAFVFIVLRMIVLYVLILISPIAFASWVLPGTEKFFSTWWKNFIRLNAMFPLITGMLAVSILLSRVLVANPATGTSGGAITLVAMVIPIVALLAIPKTLKWTTAGMSALAGGLMGAVAGKVHDTGAGAAKKGTQMAKNEGIKFGKNQAVQAVANNPNSKMAVFLGGKKKAQQEVGKMTGEHRAEATNKYAGISDAKDIGEQVKASVLRSQQNPNDLVAKADAQAGLARLNQLGGSGRNQIADIQDAFRNQSEAAGTGTGEANGAWKGMLGDAGIIGDLDAKAPELTGWSENTANFTEKTINGEKYKVRNSGLDIKSVGAPALGKLGVGAVASVAEATDKNIQFGDGTAANTGQINWQAAASMASDTKMHPENAETIAAWKEIGSQGVAHWEAVGNAAAASGDTAAFDTATANQLHAQTILTSFGG